MRPGLRPGHSSGGGVLLQAEEDALRVRPAASQGQGGCRPPGPGRRGAPRGRAARRRGLRQGRPALQGHLRVPGETQARPARPHRGFRPSLWQAWPAHGPGRATRRHLHIRVPAVPVLINIQSCCDMLSFFF